VKDASPAAPRRWRRLHPHRWRIAAAASALLVLFAAKQFYSHASAADLRWILAPTAKLVSLVSGADFAYEVGQGWVSRDVMFVIAPACSGMNFAMAAFLALTLGWLPAMVSARTAAARLVAAAALAYVATLAINAIRIAIAIALHVGAIETWGMDPAELHRIEGIVVYVAGLCALYALARAERLPRASWIAAPIGAYLAITLVLPALNGAARRADFVHHASWVVSGCAAVIAAVVVAGAARRHWNSRKALNVGE